jgi:hypothetical protein
MIMVVVMMVVVVVVVMMMTVARPQEHARHDPAKAVVMMVMVLHKLDIAIRG